MKKLSVPGSILILGEYAILEEGLGVASATSQRMYLHLQKSNAFLLEGLLPSGKTRVDSSLCEICLSEMRLSENPPMVRMSADSRNFFHPSGRKRGLGSSAALVVGLIAGIMASIGENPVENQEKVFYHALRAHRRWKRGGSGYDVAVSVYGGNGLFSGGIHPGWKAISLRWKIDLEYCSHSVDSADAVRKFLRWKRSHAREAAEFFLSSDNCVKKFLSVYRYEDLSEIMVEARRLHDNVEEETGLITETAISPSFPDIPWKRSGAGREILLYLRKSLNEDTILVEEGLRWE